MSRLTRRVGRSPPARTFYGAAVGAQPRRPGGERNLGDRADGSRPQEHNIIGSPQGRTVVPAHGFVGATTVLRGHRPDALPPQAVVQTLTGLLRSFGDGLDDYTALLALGVPAPDPGTTDPR